MKIKLIIFFLVTLSSYIFSHCQIPCGIYDDATVFSQLKQHVETIHKSVDMISALVGEQSSITDLAVQAQNQQQIVRWTMNKEEHASKIQDTMTHYFLSQRISIPNKRDRFLTKKYTDKLSLAHEVILHSMKTKQSLNLEHVESLEKSLLSFEEEYNKAR
tara:strand:+ start:2120 stop:2599 length:480 start_codon:yes stop_codon:yes gene_type:complete